MVQFSLGVYVGMAVTLALVIGAVLYEILRISVEKMRRDRIDAELRARREVWEQEEAMMKPIWNQKADLGWEDEGWYV